MKFSLQFQIGFLYQEYDDFDHNISCWLTDYIQAGLLFSIFLINLIIKSSNQNKTLKFVRIYINIALIFASLYSLAGALVHQLYNSNDQEVLYNMIWDFGQMFGFIGFIAFGAACCEIYKFVPFKYVNIGYLIVTGICIILNWTIPKYALEVCMAILFIDIVLFIVLSSLKLKQEIQVDNKQYKRVFILQIVSILIILIGAICQVLHVSKKPEFDYNAIYHCCNMISIPFIFESIYWFMEFNENDYEEIKQQKSD